MGPVGAATVDAGVDAGAELRLLGGFSLHVDGRPVSLPMHSRRVLAYLSLDHLQRFGSDRGVLAERLWPDAGAERSRASLRTALWRIRRVGPRLVLVEPETVRLGEDVQVDVHHFRHVTAQMISDADGDTSESARMVGRYSELLPGWDEPWLVLAREQLRQARLHALEARAAHLRRARRFPEAIEAMLDVIADEPLRESAHAALIDAYLSEGNASEAVRQFDLFAALLWHELGIRPSNGLCERVGLGLPATGGTTGPASISPRTHPRVPARSGRRPG